MKWSVMGYKGLELGYRSCGVRNPAKHMKMGIDRPQKLYKVHVQVAMFIVDLIRILICITSPSLA